MGRRTNRVLGLVFAVFWSGVTLAADADFPTIGELMSADEYRAAGLDKLNDAERAALEAWLVRYTARDAEVIKGTSERVKKAARERVETRLPGVFTGWRGHTVFRLENGDVWRQSGNERYHPRTRMTDPQVVIHRGLLGGYQMELVATGARVKVRRIR